MTILFQTSLISTFLMLFTFGNQSLQTTVESNPEPQIEHLDENIPLNKVCHCTLTINSFDLDAMEGVFYRVLENGSQILVSGTAPASVIFDIPRGGGSSLGLSVGGLTPGFCPEANIDYTLSCNEDHVGEPQLYNRIANINAGDNCSPYSKWFGATSNCIISTFE